MPSTVCFFIFIFILVWKINYYWLLFAAAVAIVYDKEKQDKAVKLDQMWIINWAMRVNCCLREVWDFLGEENLVAEKIIEISFFSIALGSLKNGVKFFVRLQLQ